MMNNIVNHLKKIYRKASSALYRRKFKSYGNSIIVAPLSLVDTSSIEIGNNSLIFHNAWLMGNAELQRTTLTIGDNVQIGHFVHIIAKYSVVIENSVLIADKVFITDCSHNFNDIKTSIIEQGISILGNVIIGEGSWLGENVCVIGARVGKHCVIGANSVVNRDIPDYSVAVGSPARVIKKYNFDTQAWESA